MNCRVLMLRLVLFQFVTSLLVTVIMAMINVLKTLQLIHDGEVCIFGKVRQYNQSSVDA